MPATPTDSLDDTGLLCERNKIAEVIEDARLVLNGTAEKFATRARAMIDERRVEALRDIAGASSHFDEDLRIIEVEALRSLEECGGGDFEILTRFTQNARELSANTSQSARIAFNHWIESIAKIDEAFKSVRDDLGASALESLIGLRVRCVKFGMDASLREPVPSIRQNDSSPFRAALEWLLELEAWIERSWRLRTNRGRPLASDTPQKPRRSKAPKGENDLKVVAALVKLKAAGHSPDGITKRLIAEAAGIGGSSVDKCEAWRALLNEREKRTGSRRGKRPRVVNVANPDALASDRDDGDDRPNPIRPKKWESRRP